MCRDAIGEYKTNTMSSAAALRSQIEAALADRIPSALTPAAKTIREVVPSRSCQTFNVSTTIEVLSDLHASMNDLVRRIESDDSPLGDD